MMKISILILMVAWMLPQEHKKQESERDELTVSGNQLTVVVDNIFGEIQVKKSTGNSVKYSVLKTIEARRQTDMDKGWNEVKMNVIQRNDSIIFYLTAPFICDKWSGCRENGRWVHREKELYDFSFDYTLEVPSFSNLDLQTVTDGELVISDIEGTIKANNVNGGVVIRGARSVESACTVNGNVDVYFKSSPDLDGQYKTINGTINLYCASLNAQVKAKSMNGKLYTAFDYQSMSPKVEKQVSKNGASTIYQINESLAIEIGTSGPQLSFETLNGNIYLRKL
ncbi:MAG: hypothetical protein RIC35_00380 [Marinoscillum sp.]